MTIGPTDRRLERRQQQALQLLKGAPDGLSAPALAERGIAAPSITRLAGAGLRRRFATSASIAIRSSTRSARNGRTRRPRGGR